VPLAVALKRLLKQFVMSVLTAANILIVVPAVGADLAVIEVG
jgi:hypothetical protein